MSDAKIADPVELVACELLRTVCSPNPVISTWIDRLIDDPTYCAWPWAVIPVDDEGEMSSHQWADWIADIDGLPTVTAPQALAGPIRERIIREARTAMYLGNVVVAYRRHSLREQTDLVTAIVQFHENSLNDATLLGAMSVARHKKGAQDDGQG